MTAPTVQRRARSEHRHIRGSRTLDRGLLVLEWLAQEPGGLTVSELARRIGTHRSNLYRLLLTLARHRLVRRDRDRRYVLGTGLLGLAGGLAGDLRSVAAPVLAELAEATGATAFLAMRDGDELVVIAVAEPKSRPCYIAYRVGFRHPVGRRTEGLAALSRGQPALARSGGAGDSLMVSEPESGVFELAAPIEAGDGPSEASVGVVTLPGADIVAIACRVLAAAEAIARALP